MQAPATLDKFFEKSTSRLYEKNEIIFGANQEASGLFYVLTGKIKLAQTDKKRENILIVFGTGYAFPLAPYFLNEVQETTYTALTQVRAAWRSRADVDRFLYKHPEVMREMYTTLIRNFYERVSTLSQMTSDQRVLKGLIDLSKRFSNGCQGLVKLEITQQELADSTNLSRESTSLILNKLAGLGIVELYRNIIEVDLDKAKTRLLAE